MTLNIGVEDILSLLLSVGIVLGGIYLAVRLVRRSVSRGGLQELEAAKRALEREIARIRQQEEVRKG